MDTLDIKPTSPRAAKTGLARILAPFTDLFGLNRAAAVAIFLATIVVVGFAIFWFFHSAPPRTLIITAGPPGSAFETNAIQYREILAKQGVRLRILPSEGSRENLKRLNDPSNRVDIGFVQGGLTNREVKIKLESLGSVAYEPLVIFYRGTLTSGLLSELKGKRLAIGARGSGTRTMARTLFEMNGMETNSPNLLDLEAEDAANALIEGRVDAAFLMGDSASPAVMRKLAGAPDIKLFSFSQADAYTRRVGYLNKLEVPMGAFDFGKNIPTNNVYLIGPTVEILARPNLHPALCDLILEAARQVHGGAKLLQRKDEFPANVQQYYPISEEAARYYKSGRTLLYRYVKPFWLASLVNRILVTFVPVAFVIIPGLRLIPAMFKWRIRMLLYRRYRQLLAVEGELRGSMSSAKRHDLLARLNHIESSLGRMKIPASFGDQFYGLRGHIDFVRNRLAEGVGAH
jgi:TRAP-type uncharacterized transport system substrate-binding protein